MPTSERVYLWVEYATLFFVLPLLFCFRQVHVPLPLLLFSAAATCWWLLSRDRTFDRTPVWNAAGAVPGLPGMIGLWLVAAFVLGGGVWFVAPQHFLDLPRERFGLWIAVMILYPLISVFPQTIVYRVFIFHRYGPLFQSRRAMVWASALAFCFGHVIFGNWLALALTLPGGLIFANTYARYRSGCLVSIEHALYGCLVFTVGLGQFLYMGAAR